MKLNFSAYGRDLGCAAVFLVGLVSILLGCNHQTSPPPREKIARNRPPATGQLITLSADGTHLINSHTNKPVFITGDAPQLLMLQISFEDVEIYLADRSARGFNALWVYPADPVGQANAPKNYYGDAPFNGADFTNENPVYWAYVDKVLKRASSYGITLVLDPGFVGLSANPGYLKSYLNSSHAVMTAYGAWLGNRYKNYDNIIWSVGGDADPSEAGLYAKLGDLAAGLSSAVPNHLITLEACRWCTPRNQSSLNVYGGNPPIWLDLNWAYNMQPTVVDGCQKAFNASPTFLPPLMGEDWYELEHSMTSSQVRGEGYWEALSGCYLGRLFGNEAIYSFNSPKFILAPTWQSQLGSDGSVGEEMLGRLMRTREHWMMVPDIEHTVVTAGYGAGGNLTTTSRTSDGQTIIAYIPNGNATTISVDMTKITSQRQQARCWWFNPRNGAATQVGVFANMGTQKFTPPDSNDWVLVVDDVNSNLDVPGNVQSEELRSRVAPNR
jgi:hypothetical protein